MNPVNGKVMVVESEAGIPDRLVSANDVHGDPFPVAVPDLPTTRKKPVKSGLGSLPYGFLVSTLLTFCALSAAAAIPLDSDEVRKFAELPPSARIKVWRDNPSKEFMDVLIADGVDAVPALANLVHRGGSDGQRAVDMLCSIDRFVPADVTRLPEFSPSISVPALDIRGRLDPFTSVNGTRIGKQGLEAIRWAAEQRKDKLLALAAQECSGELESRLRALPLESQLEVWKKTIEECYRWDLCVFVHNGLEEREIYLLDTILAQHGSESLAALLSIVQSDENGWVRWEAIETIFLMNDIKMRLSTLTGGQAALGILERELDASNNKRFFKRAFLRVGSSIETENGFRKTALQHLNRLRLAESMDNSLLTDLTIFSAFAAANGETVSSTYNSASGVLIPDKTMRAFVAYLSVTDPQFPSWEYSFNSGFMSDAQILHSRFEAKMNRLLAAWKTFKNASRALP